MKYDVKEENMKNDTRHAPQAGDMINMMDRTTGWRRNDAKVTSVLSPSPRRIDGRMGFYFTYEFGPGEEGHRMKGTGFFYDAQQEDDVEICLVQGRQE